MFGMFNKSSAEPVGPGPFGRFVLQERVDLLPDLEDITNAVATFSLYCPSNDVGYDLFGTTNLSVATEAGGQRGRNADLEGGGER
jgi:hypothetical protein